MKTCLLTLIKDEHLYLKEFIDYHLAMGVDEIFLFEDLTSKTHREIVDKYGDNVVLHSVLSLFPEEEHERIWYEYNHLFKMQNRYLKAALPWVKKNSDADWCFVIDADEFITLNDGYQSIESVLSEFKDYEAVSITWQNYGATGHIMRPDYKEKGLIETYTQEVGNQKTDGFLAGLKTIYNMRVFKIENYLSQHIASRKAKWCKTDFSQDFDKRVMDKMYIRHYVTKSWEEYVVKLKIRGMFYISHRKLDSFFDLNTDLADRKEELLAMVDEIIEKNKEKTES